MKAESVAGSSGGLDTAVNAWAGRPAGPWSDSWRFSDVAKQAKCDWEQFNTARTMTCDVDQTS